MYNRLAVLTIAFALHGCASNAGTGTAGANSVAPAAAPAAASTPATAAVPVGAFFQSGPTNADADVLSIKWLYGFRFQIDPKTVNEVKLSCAPIPGTTFTVKGTDLKVKPDRSAVWEGEVLPVTKTTTPWLLDAASTTAICVAVVSRVGMADARIETPINFTPLVKTTTLAQLKTAHEFNVKAKKK